MLNALLNLLLFYNKIYAFHLVAVARRQKVHRTREEVEELEGETESGELSLGLSRWFGNRVKNLFHEMKTHTANRER